MSELIPSRRRSVSALSVLSALSVVVSPLSAQSRDWLPDERAIIGDFTSISAVAVARDRVFVVTASGMITWDPQAHRWSGPWQPREPALLHDVFIGLSDPLDGSLWLARRNGWLRFDPDLVQWEQGGVPGEVLDAALDRNAPGSGLYLRTGSGWYTAQRGGVTVPGSAPTRPLRAASVQEAIRENPAIQATSGALLFGGRLRAVRFTAAARSEGFTGRGWFLGTAGAGLVFFGDGAGLPEPLTFGLPSGAVDAVFAGPGGVWAVTRRTSSADPSLSFVSADFTSFHWFQGPRATGLPFTRARRVVGLGSDLWIATEAGVVRIRPKSDEVERFDEGRGLPDMRVLDLEQRRGRVVAGTAHGLAGYSDSAGFERLASGFSDAALSVAISGDTTWVGTGLGLFAAVPGAEDLLQPQALRESAAMQAPVLDLVWRADTLVALLADRLLWRDPGTGRYTLGPVFGAALGRVHTVANGRSGLYLAGDRGVAFTGLTATLRRPFTVPGDLPAEPTGLAVDDSYLWVATLNGLVRFSLDVVGR
jgi:hypothetical protein